MDVVTLGAAKADAKRKYANRQLPGSLPAPVCAGRAAHPNAYSALTAQTFQRIYQFYTDATQIRLVYANLAIPGSGNTTPEGSAGPITVKASVIWDWVHPAGTMVPVTFGGQSSVTIAAFGIAISDPIDVSFTQASGSYFPVRTYVTQAGTYLPLSGPPLTMNGWNEGYNAGDLTLTANSWNGATNDLVSGYGPTAVIGWGPLRTNKTTLITGDSIPSGTGWPTSTGSYGFIAWALHQAQIGAINLAHSSEQFKVVNTYTNSKARLNLANGSCSNAICEYGINDIFATSDPIATVKANALLWWGYLKKRGMWVAQTTLGPNMQSTDGFQTVANQSILGTSTQQTIRQQFNQWLRAPIPAGVGNSALLDAAGNLDYVFDAGSQVEVNADGSLITINTSTGAISNGSGGYWYTEATSYATGTVTTIPSSQKLQDTSKTWTVNQWQEYAVVITADTTTPASVGQVRIISANTVDTLTSDSAWTTTPSTVATYKLIKVFSFDGTHPSAVGHKRMAAAIDTSKLSRG